MGSRDTCLVSRCLETLTRLCLGSVSTHSCLVLVQVSQLNVSSWLCIKTVLVCLSSMRTSLTTIRFEQLMLVKCNQHAMTVSQYYVLVRRSDYDCNVCFVKACRSNVKMFWMFWFVSRLDTCVSAVSEVSNIFTMSQTRLVSAKSEMSWLISCLHIPLSCPMSLSQKNVSTPSLIIAYYRPTLIHSHVCISLPTI